MPLHVRCSLPNASHSIGGVAFVDHPEGGVVTADPLHEDKAAMFDGVPGYSFYDAESGKPVKKPGSRPTPEKKDAAEAAEAAAAALAAGAAAPKAAAPASPAPVAPAAPASPAKA